MDFPHELWEKSYLTYTDAIVGFCGKPSEKDALKKVSAWIKQNLKPLQAYAAASSTRLFTRRSTAASANDIYSLPFPAEGTLDLSDNELILIDDIVDYLRDYVRFADKSQLMNKRGNQALDDFCNVVTKHVNGSYKRNPLKALTARTWPGVICQPFVFGKGHIDWTDDCDLRDRLDSLLSEQKSESLSVTRIARVYDGAFVFLLKPDRLRYWIRSVALRDADEIRADLQSQGF